MDKKDSFIKLSTIFFENDNATIQFLTKFK